MLKNKILLGIILSIILMIFSINGSAAYYKYTQESGANFYVGIADKADALEDTNEMRQIIDDLGALLAHSKRDDLYPKNGLFGGTIQIPEAGLKFGNAPTNDDIAAYIAGEMLWQTKAELGLDLSLYYLKTEIDTIGKVEAIWVKDIIDSDELAALKFIDLSDTPAAYDNGKYAKSTADGVVWDTPSGGYINLTSFVDQTPWRLFYSNNLGDVIELALGADGTYLKSTGATSAPIFDTPGGAGDMLKATYDSDEDGDIDVAAGGTEKSSWTQYAIPYLSGTTVFGEIPIGTAEYALTVNATEDGYDWTLFDLSLYYLKTEINTQGKLETIWGVTLATDTEISTKVDDSLTSDMDLNEYSIRVDATLSGDHSYSAIKKDLVTMGEPVVYGQLVYKKWSDGKWYLAKADASTTLPALGIALESKGDGEACLILREGYIRDDDWEFTAWMVYLSDTTAGGVLSVAPGDSGDQIQRIGDAKSADIMYFDPSIDVGEI